MASLSSPPEAGATVAPGPSRPAADGAARPARATLAAPIALAAALAAVYLIWAPPSIDLAAGEYRSWLFGREGLSLWDLQWYAGHHMPGYSVLFPPLGSLLGPRLLGALCAVAAAALFALLARRRFGDAALLGALWFAAGTATILLSGRLTFGLGLVPALGALLALAHGRRAGAAVLAVASALASPVAAVFLAMATTAWALAEPWPRGRDARRPWWRELGTERRLTGLAIAAAAVVPVGLLSFAFPEGGREPFVLSAYWPVPATVAAALLLWPREQRTLRIGAVLYLLGCTAAFVLDTPVGGNAARLGALVAGPLFALLLWRRRPLALALVALPLLYWQWTAAIHDVTVTHGDRSVERSFYAPLLAQLEARDPGGISGRVEIPFTKLHWEARWVAPRHALARGWLRQYDHKANALFYEGELTPERYEAWLRRNAVRWVALPDTTLDYSARREAELVEGGLPFLREVWRDADWRLFEVRDAAPLAEGAGARVTRLGHDAVTLSVERPGTVRLRMHWTPYWRVAEGDACVAPAPAPDGEDQTELRVRRGGEIRLVTSFSLGRVGASSPRCSG
ncbi:hypothetical protein [Conexibacter arvalis]|uniref:4-amino-4-deoxy-L-arabinose transferase n=1 Tax=Conexibacter arvalis TaxID=912552 RepID=A0A840IMA1_9ACTN|nr:hypothetical protein [Conexibacter arvalis]MBB4664990.1 hypothetical protein [Conexibacter arvalis]